MFRNLVLMVAAMISSAVLAQPVSYYSLTNPDSPHLSITEKWIQSLEPMIKFDWKKGLGCGGKVHVEKNQDTFLVEALSGRMWQSLDNGDTHCLIDTQRLEILSMFQYPYDICVASDSPIKNIQDLVKTPNAKIGWPSGTVFEKWLSEYQKSYNPTAKAIPYRSSPQVMLGILSKDIDAGIVATMTAEQQKGNNTLRCLATTAPGRANNLNNFTPKITPALNDFQQIFFLFAHNLSPEQSRLIRNSINQSITTFQMPESITLSVVGHQITSSQAKNSLDAVYGLADLTRKPSR
jgi:hypothetical protein